ncbi:MAG: hypothetical protein ABJA98_18420 [Acidobacteriota bacterium]
METIRHLPCLWRATAHTVRVRPVPIAADDPNRGMGGEPFGHGIGGADCQDIHDPTFLQIHENRAEMLLPLLPRPVVNAHHAHGFGGGGRGCPAFDHTHDGVGADRRPEPDQQALAGAPA